MTVIHPPHGTGPQRQRGVALFVVIVFVMLSMLLALWASRTAWFNELVVSNDADYQRAFEAAQALLEDAELDIRGERADGRTCTPDAGNSSLCRRGATIAQIPLETQEVGQLLAYLELQTARCKDGLCVKRLGRQDFWNYISTDTLTPPAASHELALDQLSIADVGARYGQYTISAADLSSAGSNNPILGNTGDWNEGGWYWIEVLKYDDSSQLSGVIVSPGASASNNVLSLNLLPSVVYRITAVAHGHRRNADDDPVTTVVIQETYARHKRRD